MQALGANGLQKKINLCPFKWQKKIKWSRLCQSAAFYSSSPSPVAFWATSFFPALYQQQQPGYSSSSLKKQLIHCAGRLILHQEGWGSRPQNKLDMCFICRRGTKALYLVTGAASSSILPSGKLTNYTPLFISKKKNKTKQQQKATKKPNKQLSIFISLLLPPNTSCISTV